MTHVKICGLTLAGDAAYAESLGASYLGVILAGGPRLLTVERAREVLGVRRPHVQRVAVFGDQTDDTIARTADALDLDILQLHNDPNARQLEQLQKTTARRLWPVVRMSGATIPSIAAALGRVCGVVVLDAKVLGSPGLLGGTGIALDWNAMGDGIAALREAVPGIRIVLAGGLRPGNVAEAIGLLQPDVVDVSSGVESQVGIKDRYAVEQFVAAASTA